MPILASLSHILDFIFHAAAPAPLPPSFVGQLKSARSTASSALQKKRLLGGSSISGATCALSLATIGQGRKSTNKPGPVRMFYSQPCDE